MPGGFSIPHISVYGHMCSLYNVSVTQYNVLKRPPRGGFFSYRVTLWLIVDFVGLRLLALALSTISELHSDFALYMELVHVLGLFPVVGLPSSKL